MKITQKQAVLKHKHGMDLKVYPMNNKKIGLVYEDVKGGHFEEFYHKKSIYTYFVLEGTGTFYLDGKRISVKFADVVTIPPMTKIYFLGEMKLLLITTPAWQPQHEVHVRDIEKQEK
jgi:mannose-6-phosphate isomerase-like protein (cupin superfamily)